MLVAASTSEEMCTKTVNLSHYNYINAYIYSLQKRTNIFNTIQTDKTSLVAVEALCNRLNISHLFYHQSIYLPDVTFVGFALSIMPEACLMSTTDLSPLEVASTQNNTN